MSIEAPVGAPAKLFVPPGDWDAIDSAFDALWQQACDIEGWLSESQARALYRAASAVPAGQHIVEIGSHCGRSTVFLAMAKPQSVLLHAVDPFDNPRWGGGPEALDRFHATLDRFDVRADVRAFRGVSAEASAAWDGEPIGLLFVDGAHDRASVLADIDGWEQHVAPGGIVFFHDAFSSIGVTQALTERHLLNRRFRYLGSTRTLVAFERVDLTTRATLTSAASMASRYPYFARNSLTKLALRRDWGRVPSMLRYRPGDDLF